MRCVVCGGYNSWIDDRPLAHAGEDPLADVAPTFAPSPTPDCFLCGLGGAGILGGV